LVAIWLHDASKKIAGKASFPDECSTPSAQFCSIHPL
jgi:hypothetical protein